LTEVDERTGIVVIGAGFAGLSAAHALKAAGVDFLVLEARDRVGGRVESQLNGFGERLDTGGQFLCDDMPEIMALAKAHGKTLLETRLEGEFVAQPPLPAGEARKVYANSMAIRERMLLIEPKDPAIAGLTVADWLGRQPDGKDAKAAFRAMVEGLWCLDAERLPLWYLIDNDRRITNEVHELQYSLAETMHSLAEDLARDLGDRVQLATAAIRVEHGPDGVRIVTPAGVIDARAVIIAVPPATAARLAFKPALPPALSRALGAWESGAVIKVMLRYRRAFWRDRGLSGMVAWREPQGLFAFDCSPDADHPMLTFFLAGPLALGMHSASRDSLRAEVVARLVTALGPQAAEIEDMLVRDWSRDEWSGGAYSDLIVDMGATDAEDILRQGLPRVAFAPSEISPSFAGYIEGAIVAGRAGAVRVIAELGIS
jgi:monoamine oxidase